MSTLNDAQRRALRNLGFTGSLPKMLLDFFRQGAAAGGDTGSLLLEDGNPLGLEDQDGNLILENGGVSNISAAARNTAERAWLRVNGARFAQLSDMWRELLLANGYSGSVPGMKRQFWRDGGQFASVPAMLTSAVVENATPNTLTVIFNKAITSANYIDGVVIRIDGSPVTGLASATVSPSNTIVYTFSENVEFGDMVTYTYTPGDYTDSDSLPIAAIGNSPVTNNVELAAPVFSGTIPTLNVTINEEITPVDYSAFFTGQFITYSWENTIPTGLTLNPSTGILTGTPTVEVSDASNFIRATNAGGSDDSNNFTVNVSATPTGTVDDLLRHYGTASEVGLNSAITVPAQQGTISSIAINSASSGSASDFENLDSDKIALASGHSFSSQTVLNCTATFINTATDDFVLTINPDVGGFTVGTVGSIAGTPSSASRNYGDQIYVRGGTYDFTPDAPNTRIRRNSAPGGTFTGSNYITIQASQNEEPVLSGLRVDANNSDNPAFRFTNLNFGEGGILFVNGDAGGGRTWNSQVDNCVMPGFPEFVPDPDGTGSTAGLATGINVVNGGDSLTFVDNTISNVLRGIFAVGTNVEVSRNTITTFYEDAIRTGGTGNVRVDDNFMRAGGRVNDTVHPDFWQHNGGNFNTSNIEVNRNICITDVEDGAAQGLFCDDTGDGFVVSNTNIRGNLVYIAAFNGIVITRGDDTCDISGNTVVSTSDSSASIEARIRLLDPVSATPIRFNITEAIIGGATTFNTIVNKDTPGSYTSTFANPLAGASITDPATMLDTIGGSAPRIAIPEHGYNARYVDFTNNTSDFPWLEDGFTPSPADLTNVSLSSPVTVNEQVTGVSATGTLFYITGGNSPTFDILQSDGSTVVESGIGVGLANARILSNNQFYRINDTSDASNDTQTDIVITAGDQTDTWSFTTEAAAAGLSVSYLRSYEVDDSGQTVFNSTSGDFPAGDIFVGISRRHTSVSAVSSLTINGVSGTLVTDGTNDSFVSIDNNNSTEWWRVTLPSAATNVPAILTLAGTGRRVGMSFYSVTGAASGNAHAVDTSTLSGGASSTSVNVEANGVTLTEVFSFGDAVPNITWTGVDGDHTTIIASTTGHSSANRIQPSAQTPLTVTASFGGSVTSSTMSTISISGA